MCIEASAETIVSHHSYSITRELPDILEPLATSAPLHPRLDASRGLHRFTEVENIADGKRLSSLRDENQARVIMLMLCIVADFNLCAFFAEAAEGVLISLLERRFFFQSEVF